MEQELCQSIVGLLASPLLNNQYDNLARRNALRRDVEEAARRTAAVSPAEGKKVFEAAIGREPDDWYLHEAYGELLSSYGDFAGAAEQYRAVLKIVPQYRAMEYATARALVAQGKPAEAADVYRRLAAQIRPALAYVGLATTLAAEKKYDEAIEQCQVALAADGQCMEAIRIMTEVMAAKGKFDAAALETVAGHLRVALAERPAMLEFELAQLYARLEQWDKAVEHYRQAVAADPREIGSRQALAGALARWGRGDEAVAALEEAMRVDEENPAIRADLAMAALARGRRDEATAHYQKMHAIRPDSLACRELGNLAVGARDLAEAEKRYREAIALAPRDAMSHNNLAQVLTDREPDEAIAHFRIALEVNADYGMAHMGLGRVLQKKGQAAEAISHYRRAVELNNRPPQVLYELAWLLSTASDCKLRNGAEARKLAEEACEKTRHTSPRAIDVLAAAHAESGQFDQAVRTATVAADLAEACGNRAMADSIRQRVALYQSRKAYRVE